MFVILVAMWIQNTQWKCINLTILTEGCNLVSNKSSTYESGCGIFALYILGEGSYVEIKVGWFIKWVRLTI